MLDGLLGRGFAPKCKSLIKLTKTRIDVIRRKRRATEKFLKKDIADLLVNGLDSNAYQRVVKQAGGLLVELTLSLCYDFVEQSCDFILKHLSIMQKQSECPEDCREAVSSLMFAAARFSDLPELRDLRQILQGRYGNSLELYVNQAFVENLASKPSTLEKKVQVMEDIAVDFSITWDSKAFEKRMSKPPTYAQDQPKTYGSFHVTVDENKYPSGRGTIPRGEKPNGSFKERIRPTNNGHELCNGHEGTVLKREPVIQSTHELSGKGYKVLNGKEGNILKKDGLDIPFQGRQDVADGKHEAWNLREDATSKSVRFGSSSREKRVEGVDGGSRLNIARENTPTERDFPGSFLRGKPEISPSCAGLQSKENGKEPVFGNYHSGQQDITNSVRKVEEVIIHNVKPYYNSAIPPPYLKSNLKPKPSRSGPTSGSSLAGFNGNVALTDPLMCKGGNAGSISERIQLVSDHSERQVVVPATVNNYAREKDHLHQDDVTRNPIPKPRSARRHAKSHSDYSDASYFKDTGVGTRKSSTEGRDYNDTGYFEDTGVATRKSRSKGRDDSRRGLKILFDDEQSQKDEEERILDKLLMQYSKKPSPYESGRVRRKSKARQAQHMDTNAGESAQNSRDGPEEKPGTVPYAARSVSLPREHTGPSEATKKVFSRAASFQPDRSNPVYVHPKLPDYDDLTAKFAALRGR